MQIHLYKILTLGVALLFSVNSRAQKNNFFNSKQIQYFQIDSVENQQASVEKKITYEVGLSADYFPDVVKFNIGQPRVFERSATKEFIPCQVEYFYDQRDSIVRLIDYTWDVKNSITITTINDLKREENDQSGKIKLYNSEFWVIARRISKSLNKSAQGDGKFNRHQDEGESPWFERQLIWEKDNTHVELNMIWSESGGVLGTYRIRAKIYWN